MKHITVEKVILFLAASFAAYNFGLAGGYIEGTRFSAGGLFGGVVVNISLAIAASRYGSIKGDKRTAQARAAFWGMVILSPVLVSPVIFYSLPDTFLGHWVARAAWSFFWPLVADLAIVLAGAVSGKGLIALSEQTATQTAKPASRKTQTATQTAKSTPQETQTAKVYVCEWPNCGAEFAKPQSFSAHVSQHKRKEAKILAEIKAEKVQA